MAGGGLEDFHGVHAHLLETHQCVEMPFTHRGSLIYGNAVYLGFSRHYRMFNTRVGGQQENRAGVDHLFGVGPARNHKGHQEVGRLVRLQRINTALGHR